MNEGSSNTLLALCPNLATFLSPALSTSWGYQDKLKAWWLKTMEIYFLTVLETKNPKIISLGRNHGVGRATLLVETQQDPFLAPSSSWWLPAFLGLWSHPSSFQGQHHQTSLLCLHMVFSFCVLNLPLPLSYKDACVGI